MNDADRSIGVKVLFFGAARDAAGVSEAELSAVMPASVQSMRETVFANFPGMPAVAKGLMIAVNEEYARPETALSDGDVVAFLPPVSGG